MDQTTNYRGVTCTITMCRTLYLPKNDKTTDEEFINLAKKEIVLPHNALAQIQDILHRVNVNIAGLDLKDWNVTNVEYTLL